MTKLEFLSALRDRLAGLPKEDLERSLEYYSESIDDRMEDGLTEEEAVEAMGSIDEIVAQILMGTSRPKPGEERPKPRPKPKPNSGSSWGWGLIALLILGFPLWFPLLITFASIVFSLYVVFWSLIVVLYAVDVTFAAAAIAGIFGSAAVLTAGSVSSGLFALGAGLTCAGLAILWFFGCTLVAKGMIWLSKTFFLAIKSCFSRRKGKERTS